MDSKIKLNRREFLLSSSFLTIGFSLSPHSVLAKLMSSTEQSFAPNAFLRIFPDDSIKIIMNHSEMGQGIYTSLSMIVAEELDADWEKVGVEFASVDNAYSHTEFGIMATGGSSSVRTEWDRLRQVGASARAMLLEAGAAHFSVPVESLRTENSNVIDPATDRSVSYGKLTQKAGALAVPENVALKDPKNFKLIGQSIKRIEGKSKVNGSAEFGIDVMLPGMVYASIAHSPVFGGKVKSFNADETMKTDGVIKVVEIPSGVAVIAKSYWQAKKGKDLLKIDWEAGDFAKTSTEMLWQQYDELAKKPGATVSKVGEIDKSLSTKTIQGEYRFPFLAHTPMEPLNCTIKLSKDACEVWTGTQFQNVDQNHVAAVTGLPLEKVTINTTLLGGGFGRRAVPTSDFIVEAAQIAKQFDDERAVKLIWAREDDVKCGYYRPMYLHKYEVGVDDENLPVNWQHTIVGQSIIIGTSFEPYLVHDGVDHTSVEGLDNMAYAIKNFHFDLHTPSSPIPVLWWRAVGHTHTAFAKEDIVNQLANQAKMSPFAYRRELLKDRENAARELGVINALEEKSGWDKPSAADTFKGMAVHSSFHSVAGYVVELQKADNRLTISKVTACIDCGYAVNPDNIKAQVFGSAAFAYTAATLSEIAIDSGAAKQSNFHDYRISKSANLPDIDVYIVDNGLDKPTGVGEVGVPPFAPALAEAIFQATGKRVDKLPMKLDGFTIT